MLSDKKELYNYLAVFSSMFPGKQEPEKIKMYTEFLCGYEIDQIKKAVSTLGRTSEFFPTVKRFVDILEPKRKSPEDLGQDLMGRILDRAFNTSQYDKNIASGFSEEELKIVRMFGGWDCLINLTYDDLPIARAQLRNLCISRLRYSSDHGIIRIGVNDKITQEILD